MRRLPIAILLCAILAIAGCGGGSSSGASSGAATGSSTSTESTGTSAESSEAPATKPKVVVPKGKPPKKLVIKDLRQGTGKEAKAGDEVTVQYVGVLYKNGKQFDASWDRGEPFPFTLGNGEVIPGWDQGVQGMKEGGRRELIIPPNLAYGSAGAPPAIPPNETLVFVVDLLEVG